MTNPTTHTCTLADLEVTYDVCGSGIPVVLIHGLAEDRHSWGGVRSALVGLETYAYDVRGHGETSCGQAEGTLAQLGGDLLRFLEQVSGPAACVGFSLGGTIVLWAALRRPDLVTVPVAVATSSVVGKRAAAFYHDRIRQAEEDITQIAPLLTEDTRAQLVHRRDQAEVAAKRRIAAVGKGGGYINAARAMAALHSDPLTPQLAKMTRPVQLITASGDRFCPQKAADIMIAALPQTNVQTIAEAGHLISVDQPERYAQAIHRAVAADD